MISDTPPTLQPVTISPCARVTIDTQTHNAQTVNIATISTPAADAQHTTSQTTTTTRPLSKITLVWFCQQVFIGRKPATNHAHVRFASRLRSRPLLFLVSLNSLDIKYSMFDVIFVRLMRSLYGILKVPAAICPLPVWNQLRPRLLLFLLLLNSLGIKYSMYDAILLG